MKVGEERRGSIVKVGERDRERESGRQIVRLTERETETERERERERESGRQIVRLTEREMSDAGIEKCKQNLESIVPLKQFEK